MRGFRLHEAVLYDATDHAVRALECSAGPLFEAVGRGRFPSQLLVFGCFVAMIFHVPDDLVGWRHVGGLDGESQGDLLRQYGGAAFVPLVRLASLRPREIASNLVEVGSRQDGSEASVLEPMTAADDLFGFVPEALDLAIYQMYRDCTVRPQVYLC